VVIPAVDIAIFVFDTNPLPAARPVIITIPVPIMFTATPVVAIAVPISIVSAAVVVPFTVAAISMPVAFAAITGRSLPFVGLLRLLL
jgi:hypothetical protein